MNVRSCSAEQFLGKHQQRQEAAADTEENLSLLQWRAKRGKRGKETGKA